MYKIVLVQICKLIVSALNLGAFLSGFKGMFLPDKGTKWHVAPAVPH